MTPLQAALLDWWAAHGRDLPWRRSRDPWAVLVSEFMLQQTQVSRVEDRYRRFLRRFPTPAACAAAPVADVVDEWAGLGLQPARRPPAPGCHASASADHGGALPDRPRRPAGPSRRRARTRPGPCWCSPTSVTSAWSTPMPDASWPGPWRVGPSSGRRRSGSRMPRCRTGGAGPGVRRSSISVPRCVASARRRATAARCVTTARGRRAGLPAAGPHRRLGRHQRAAVPLRRVRSTRTGPARRRDADGAGPPTPISLRPWAGPDDPERAERVAGDARGRRARRTRCRPLAATRLR